MQHKAEASGLVAGVDLAYLSSLLRDPGKELVGIELLRSLRRLSVVLADEDVFLLVDVDSDLEDLGCRLILFLRRGSGGGFFHTREPLA